MDKLNKKMGTVLTEIMDIRNGVDYTKVSDLVNTEFYEIEGCVLRNKGEKVERLNIDKILCVYNDRTGYEASFNEVRINDYIEELHYGPVEGLALALRIIEDWENRLKQCFPNYTFHIIVVFDDEYTTVRFYKFRNEEGSWIDIDNLDGYSGESVLVKIV